MTDPQSEMTMTKDQPKKELFLRFDVLQRIEHGVFLLSFALLGVTGLAQKFYSDTTIAAFIIRLFGGIETTRIIHRTSSVVMMIISAFHIIGVLYRIIVLRVTMDMFPSPQDFKDLIQDILYNIGRRAQKAAYGRYNYAEKVEYFAVVWGTLIMGITGFMMWNPIATARFLPGEFIPAAKAAHGGEAILAVLAIIVWHFYHVHLRHFNRSMFTGVLTREEMEEEHPAELKRIKAGQIPAPPTQTVIRQREQVFIPIAAIISLVLGVGIFMFINLEETAITTFPPGESAEVFVPQTPTPEPTPTPSPTPAEILTTSWDGGLEGLFRNRCSTCHGFTSVGGLSFATYEQALQGGDNGPAIVPGDPEAGTLLEIQATGNHPGQFTQEELDLIIEWIEAGAPEK